MEKEKKVPFDVYIVLLTETLNVTGALILLPVQPFFAISLGANAFDLSVMSSIYSLSQTICNLFMGELSDRYGRKPLMLLGLVASTALYVVQSKVDSIMTFILVRAALGVACSTGPVEMAYVLDAVPDSKEREKVIGLQMTCCTMGAFIGPMISGVLAPYGFPVLCYVMASITGVNFFVGLALWQDHKKDKEPASGEAGEKSETVSADTGSLCANPTVVKLLMVTAINSFAWMVSDGPETIFLAEHFNFGARDLAKFFCAITFVMCIMSIATPAISEKIGNIKTCVIGYFGSAVTVASLLVFTDWWEPYLYGCLGCGVFSTMTSIASMNVLADACPEEQRGRLMGISASLGSLGSFIGPMLGGALYVYDNYTPYVLTSVALSIGGFIFISMPPPPAKKADKLLPIDSFRRAVRKVKYVRWMGGSFEPLAAPNKRTSSCAVGSVGPVKQFTLTTVERARSLQSIQEDVA